MLTPSDLDILIHCYVSPEPHPRIHAGAVLDSIRKFIREEILTGTDMANVYKVTDKGEFFIKMILDIPYPEMKWVDPRK